MPFQRQQVQREGEGAQETEQQQHQDGSIHQDTPSSGPGLATPTSTVWAPRDNPPVVIPPPPHAMPAVPISAPLVPLEKGPQDETLPVLLTEEEQDLPPPAYTPIDPHTLDIFSDSYSVSPQRSVPGGSISGAGYPPEKGAGGWREHRQRDAAQWYGHELEGSDVPQSGGGSRGAPQSPVMELPGDGGLGDQGASRASVSGDGRVSITISPHGVLGIKGRQPTLPDITAATTPTSLTPDSKKTARSLTALSSLSALLSSQRYMRKKQEVEKYASHPHLSYSLAHAEILAQPPPITPRLNIVMQIIGSRGDVQPFLSLALVLAREPYNHRIRVATHACFEGFVTEVAATNNLSPGDFPPTKGSIEFFPLAGDPAVLMSYMVRNPGLIPSTSSLTGGEIRERRRGVWEILVSTWESCHEAYLTPANPTPRPFVADLIVANPPGFGHVHCGEKLGVPVHIMFTMPWAPPTSAFPHPLANLPERTKDTGIDEATINYLTYSLLDILTWQGTGDLINRFRTEVLRLDSINNVYAPTLVGRLAGEGVLPHTYCWSPALIPKPKDWDRESISVSGFWFLDLNSGYTPPQALKEFMETKSEKPLIYIGFGSIVAANPQFLTNAVLGAVKAAGVRALVSTGWGTITPLEGFSDSDIFFLGNTPHDWLFPKVKLAVHHGGAGTTAAAIKAGIPSGIVPFFGDQQFWGEMVSNRGAGGVLHSRNLTEEALAGLITSLLEEGVKMKARELGEIVNKEQGEEVAARGLLRGVEGWLKGCEVEARMGLQGADVALGVFTIIPRHEVIVLEGGKEKRKRTKNTAGIRISARVAHVLHKEGWIDVDDPKMVRLTRWIEWDSWVRRVTETDPATGGAGALLGTLVAMGMAGGVDFDRDVWFGGAKGKEKGKDRVISSASSTTGSVPTTTITEDGAAPAPPITSSHIDTLNAALATSKPLSTIISAGLKSPVDFSLSVSRGFHHLPQTLFSDTTVRPLPPVHSSIKGFGSGVNVATKQMAYGLYDGITGLVTEPMRGLREGGAPGLIHGLASGIAGVVAKPAAGAFGVTGYLGMGVVREMEKWSGKEERGRLWEAVVRIGRLREGEQQAELMGLGEWEREEIVRVWKELVEAYLRDDIAGRRVPEAGAGGSRPPGLSAMRSMDGLGHGLSSKSSSKGFLGKFGGKGKERRPSIWSRSTGDLATMLSCTSSGSLRRCSATPVPPHRMNTFESEGPVQVEQSRSLYEAPEAGYDEDEALQRALKESLSMSGGSQLPCPAPPSETCIDAHSYSGNEDADLRAALLASLHEPQYPSGNTTTATDVGDEEDLQRAIWLSEQDHAYDDPYISRDGRMYNPNLVAPMQVGVIAPDGQELLPPTASYMQYNSSDIGMDTPAESDDELVGEEGEDAVLRRVLESSRLVAEEEERVRREWREAEDAEVRRGLEMSLGMKGGEC
ncbi:hypothetical protein EV426DRAFT_713400 [Tirmania nivea]|nr:hypothetical protein EV426DRAFT_713400 [Tirmania nivea]